MPRAYPQTDHAEPARDPQTGEWQALRGELVALLDKVESHYGPIEAEPEQPAMTGLARRMQTLRDQMEGTEGASRRREALQTVKKAVDRFSERDGDGARPAMDDLTSAIAEIRSRQGVQPHPMRRASDMPDFRELGALVGGMSQRLERLESELKTQRSGGGQVREVASQVEQLTQVVELLAGAIGETGQVKRLEAQIAALGVMIEDAPRADLMAVNQRLDDVSATVGKLAELQAQQMEREITRDNRQNLAPEIAKVVPAMDAIEQGVRSVYDRIDAIERSVALSSADFERLTSEMAAFTQAMRDKANTPDALVGRIEALAEQFGGMDSANSDVAGLKGDIAALRDTLAKGMEPRFLKIESQIEALSGKITPVDTGAVENQLKALMARMDEAGAQLDGLSKLYSDGGDFEALAAKVAERTSEAMTRKAPAPVAMFGPDSLKSIEDRLTGLIKSAGKTPDYETLADMIATRAGEAVQKANSPVVDDDAIGGMEQRMTALLNTAGKDTAERLARLEAALTGRTDLVAPKAAKASAKAASQAPAPKAEAATVAPPPAPPEDPFAAALLPSQSGADRLDAILADLDLGRDAMPADPLADAPLIDRAGAPQHQSRMTQAVAAAQRTEPAPVAGSGRAFDPASAQKPPRPQSTFAADDRDPFAEPAPKTPAAPTVAVPSSTSTFVAAARRAQRAKQEDAQPAPTGTSLVGRALARVRSCKADAPGIAETVTAAPVVAAPEPAPARQSRKDARDAAKAAREAAKVERATARPVEDGNDTRGESFLTRHRRPLLLAATLVAVSMLALNLVLQRSNPPPSQPTPTEAVVPAPLETPAPEPVTAAPADQTSAVPPRVIDLVDPTSTGTINPGQPMSFSRAALAAPVVPPPPALATIPAARATTVPEPTEAADVAEVEPETFDLPPEAVGPLDLREAAAAGNAQAQFEIAAILGEGQVMDADLEASAAWYQRSAAQGFVPAQYRMGNLYELGNGVEQDLEQARLWYQRAAEAGNRMAMHNLAALYAGGQLGEQQFELAAEWFQDAADRGMTDSQFNLGMLYARGLGVEQSFEQSYKWFSLAALNGDTDAEQAREDIARSLTAEAVGRMDAEVEAWRIAPIDFAANFAPMGTWSASFDPGEAVTGREVVLRVQQALARLGFDVGTPDGMAGPNTADAIRAFERATGMTEVGVVNPRLLAVLGSQPV